MIRIIPAAPPPDFYEKVELKGEKWLLLNEGNPKLPRYWASYSHDLYQRYCGICAYTGTWISEAGMGFDHFLPKSLYPKLAYKWSNYRLTSATINSKKLAKTGLLDPFEVPDGAFRIRLDTGEVFIHEAAFADKEQLARARAILKILPMNIVQETHLKWLDDFMCGEIKERILRRDAPFLYSELQRQKVL